MTAEEAYVLSKSFTKKSLDGQGALKGAPCTIKSITEVDGGQKVTFEWTGISGTKQTSEMTVKNGVSVTGISDKGNGKFTLLLSDGSESDPIQCVKGEDGFSPTATVEKVGKVATITITDKNGTTTATIKDGEGSEGGEANAIDSISVNGVNVVPDENKNVDITVPSIEGLTKDADLATVAKSGNYEDLSNKPAIPSVEGLAKTTDIPTKVSELTDSADYAKTADVNNSISTLQTDKADASDLTTHTDDADIHVTTDNKTLWNTVEDKVDKSSIATVLDDTVTDEQVASALLAKTELDKKVDKTSIATELSDASTDDEVVGALTAYNELQKLESANKEQFATTSGDYITVNDSVDGNIIDLKLYGKSEQKQYSGKNLLNPDWIPTKTVNGVTVTNNGDNSWTFSGSITDTTKAFGFTTIFTKDTSPSQFHKAGYYTISVKGIDLGESNQFAYVNLYYNGNPHYNFLHSFSKPTNRITEEMLAYDDFRVFSIGVYLGAGNTLKTGTISVQIEYSETATEFEPYVGGIPAPNPSYPQAINSVGDDGSLVVRSCGKNVLKNTNGNNSSHGITYTKNSDGSISCTGTQIENSYYMLNNDLEVDFKGKYILSGNTTTNSNEWGYCLFLQLEIGDNQSNYIFNNNPDEVVCDFSKYPTLRRVRPYIRISKNATALTDKTVTFYPMLRPYGTDGTYEPYKETVSTIPLSEPLRAIGDVKDEITYQDGKWGVLRRIKEKVITSTSKINPDSALAGETYDVCINLGTFNDSYCVVNKISDISKSIFDKFVSKNTWAVDECGAYISWTGDAFARMSSSICGSTLDEVNTYLSNNPITTDYVLATPVFEPFADQSLPYLSTYDGVTNISNDDALSAEMTVKYPTTDASGLASRNESRIAELAKDTDGKFDDVNDSLSVIGKCKNLLKPTLQTTTKNGVTCTRNVDGTYTLNGTATKDAYIVILEYLDIPNGKYLINSFNDVDNNKVYTFVNANNKETGNWLFDIANAKNNKFEMKSEYESYKISVGLAILKDTTVNNVIAKPMLVDAEKFPDTTYDDFVPYTGDGDTLTHDVAEIKNDLGGLKFSLKHYDNVEIDSTHNVAFVDKSLLPVDITRIKSVFVDGDNCISARRNSESNIIVTKTGDVTSLSFDLLFLYE